MPTLEKVPEKYNGKKIYSISKLQSYHQCQYCYYLNYIEKVEGKDNIYNVLGSLTHECLEKLQMGEITKEQALEDFKNKLIEMELTGYKFPSDKVELNFRECMYHFFNNYIPIEAKKIKLEHEFYTEIGGHILRGFIDVLALKENDLIEIYDYKTSSAYSDKDIENKYRYQLLLYAYAIEKENNKKIHAIKWNFLKYCNVEYEAQLKKETKIKTKKGIQRNQIVKELYKEINKQLINNGISQAESELILETALSNNKIPEILKSKFKITDYYLEYNYNNETKNELFTYIIETIREIEMKSKEMDFTATTIDKKTEFFCRELCSYSKNCKYYLEYTKMNQEKEQEILDLFS